ncbi:MAG: DNA repair protein RecO [Bacteroidetes bacterium B1(2017)]|nr:MAG: DNA repair protein RecO [Bacteroidetes bacterium B1(2017)]
MLQKCRGIVISTVNYSENSVVLKCYTDTYGLQSYMINGVKGKKGAIKPSHLMPLSLLELEVYHQQNKNLHRIKELKSSPILNHLHFELRKSTLALFMAELLGKILREESEPDAQLFGFIFNSVQMVDISEEGLPNFPIYFMLQLSKYLGFYPKDNYSSTCTDFSLQEGVFIAQAPASIDYCRAQLSVAFYSCMNQNFEQMQSMQFAPLMRRELLAKLIRYYQLHLLLFGELKSPAVLHEVLN